MTEAEKAYQYFVIAVPENEEQAKAYFWARKALQPTLTPPNEPRAGLYGKYIVYKNKDGSLVTDCFILRPAKDPAAVAALRAYAATTDNVELASDIINWVGAEPNEPLTQADLDGMDYDKVWIDYEDGTGEWALVCRGYIYSIDTLEGAGFDFVDYMRGERLEPHGYKVYRRPPEGEEDT